jgi:hypothetical protein
MTTIAPRNPLASIADEAIEQVSYSKEQARWLDVVATSICDALDGGKACLEARVAHARVLAGLASYLANDLSVYSANRADDLQRQLDAAEAQE